MHGALRFFRLCLAHFGLDCVGRISLHCCAALLIWVGAQVCSASTTLCRYGCPWYSTVIKMDLNPVELLTCARFPELLRGPLWLPSQAFCFLSEGLATVPSILPRNRHCLSDRHPTSWRLIIDKGPYFFAAFFWGAGTPAHEHVKNVIETKLLNSSSSSSSSSSSAGSALMSLH